MVIDFLSLHRGPLRGNGHRSLYIKILCEAMVIDFLCHIEALCEAMVIDLFTSRPSAKQWSFDFPMSHRGPLRGNGHRSLYIKTLCEAMVIDFFPFDIDPLLGIGLNFFSKSQKKEKFWIGTLYMVMVVESFGSRPSPRDWSNLVFSIN